MYNLKLDPDLLNPIPKRGNFDRPLVYHNSRAGGASCAWTLPPQLAGLGTSTIDSLLSGERAMLLTYATMIVSQYRQYAAWRKPVQAL